MRALTFLIILLCFLGLLSGCGETRDVKVLKLAHGLDINHPVHLGIVNMAGRVAEKSGGQLEIHNLMPFR